MVTILDGKKISEDITKNLKKLVEISTQKPHIAVVLVGNNISSQIYVKRKQKMAESIGIKSVYIAIRT